MENQEKKSLKLSDENKKIFILIVAILVVMFVCYFIVNLISGGNKNDGVEVSSLIEQNKTAVLYVWNSDTTKCEDCKKIKKHLDKEKINYLSYDVKGYSKTKYQDMLRTLSINPPDFNYPAVIYVKEGLMYSNIINIDDTKTVDTFIKEYQLKNVK